ncbi:ECF transporter S component [Paeniglutamicibacter sp. ABSL32-1]|uniref:general stress protein n=1 Tax=Paeniglutamicibacter quisquiliarum TaxID=2849498 RepID=UPI001C2DCCAB|nr:general stress protein [Paeniglutamicibacter quisquiliarum]MBV1779558.1 ECF transporter S component [Paeniglutamicibacter quisquiliarum]
MSSPLGASPSNPNLPGLPRGELLGRYSTYLDAQKVVDYLADNDFPVANLTIVGNDLKSVERVTAKLSYPKVAAAGAAQGAMFGVFVGLVLTIFSPGSNALAQILSSVGIGMAIWMVVGVVSYSFRRGKRDFASQSQVLATSYDVVVAFSHAHAARALAAKLPMSRTAADNGVGAHGQPVQPPAPVQAAGQSAPATPTEPGAPTSGSYSDLPDGRPQFGIRIQDNQPPAATPAPQAPAAAPASEAASTPEEAADTEPGVSAGAGEATPEDANHQEHGKHR